jgi:hypothetical protein
MEKQGNNVNSAKGLDVAELRNDGSKELLARTTAKCVVLREELQIITLQRDEALKQAHVMREALKEVNCFLDNYDSNYANRMSDVVRAALSTHNTSGLAVCKDEIVGYQSQHAKNVFSETGEHMDSPIALYAKA